jgi:uncharacterized protein (DUF305 family)
MTRTSRTVGTDRNRIRRLAALAGVLLAATLLLGCTQEDEQPPAAPANSAPVIVPGKPGEEASTIPPGEATPYEQERPNAADVEFVQNMIVHHAQALVMAELAPERAVADDVKGIADRIADSQRAEIDMLNRWLERDDQPTVDPNAPDHGAHSGQTDHTSMPGYVTPERLDALRAARGKQFDTLFLQLMMAHHEGALDMVEEVQNAGLDVRVQEIADDVAVTQSDEINRMRGML